MQTSKRFRVLKAVTIDRSALDHMRRLMDDAHEFNRRELQRELADYSRQILPKTDAVPTPEKVRDREEYLKGRYGGFVTKWSITCSDGTEITTENLDEISTFPNSRSRRITGISLTNVGLPPLSLKFEI